MQNSVQQMSHCAQIGCTLLEVAELNCVYIKQESNWFRSWELPPPTARWHFGRRAPPLTSTRSTSHERWRIELVSIEDSRGTKLLSLGEKRHKFQLPQTGIWIEIPGLYRCHISSTPSLSVLQVLFFFLTVLRREKFQVADPIISTMKRPTHSRILGGTSWNVGLHETNASLPVTYLDNPPTSRLPGSVFGCGATKSNVAIWSSARFWPEFQETVELQQSILMSPYLYRINLFHTGKRCKLDLTTQRCVSFLILDTFFVFSANFIIYIFNGWAEVNVCPGIFSQTNNKKAPG